jgi:formyltetrahydrofolate hydrolase
LTKKTPIDSSSKKKNTTRHLLIKARANQLSVEIIRIIDNRKKNAAVILKESEIHSERIGQNSEK